MDNIRPPSILKLKKICSLDHNSHPLHDSKTSHFSTKNAGYCEFTRKNLLPLYQELTAVQFQYCLESKED